MAWTNCGKSAIFDGNSLNLAKILLDLAMISPNLAKISPYMQRMALFLVKVGVGVKIEVGFQTRKPYIDSR